MDDGNGGGGGSSGGKKPKLAVFLGSIRKTMNNGLHGEGVGGGVTSLDAGRAMTPLEQHGAGGRTGFFHESGDRWTEPLRLRRRTAARRRIGHATDNDDRQQQLPPLEDGHKGVVENAVEQRREHVGSVVVYSPGSMLRIELFWRGFLGLRRKVP